MSLSVSWLQLFPEQLLADIWVSSPQGSTFKHVEDYISTLWLILYSLPQMLVNIFFLSSFFPLTQELFQNPKLNYLLRTLNLTHTLPNASNPQLAKDCWICLSSPPGDSALPTSILDWTTGNISLHHAYHGEPLFVSYLKSSH